MDYFSEKTLSTLNKKDNKYYVYRLIDPRTYQTFYVGKGCGNRVFQHCKNAKYIIATEQKEDEISLKVEQIHEIQSAGKEVIHMIHRWGLTENEAYEVEAALIDCYFGLTNIQSGHDSERGMINAEDLEKLFGVSEYTEPNEDYVIIKTTQETIDYNNGSIYDATRECWRANIQKASQYKYVLSVVKGIVREVFEVDNWHSTGTRIGFSGKVSQNPNLRALVGMLLPEQYRSKGAANPLMYKK